MNKMLFFLYAVKMLFFSTDQNEDISLYIKGDLFIISKNQRTIGSQLIKDEGTNNCGGRKMSRQEISYNDEFKADIIR